MVSGSLDELKSRYVVLCHGVQSGVAYDPDKSGQTPKYLRTGVNIALRDHGSLVGLLIKKGVISEYEYWQALVEGMEAEVLDYEQQLTEKLGTKITLH